MEDVMIDAKQAVRIAEEKLPDVVPAFAALKPFVEEVEQSQDGKEWRITFRAKNSDFQEDASYASFLPFIEKIVRLGANSGDLLAVLNPSSR